MYSSLQNEEERIEAAVRRYGSILKPRLYLSPQGFIPVHVSAVLSKEGHRKSLLSMEVVGITQLEWRRMLGPLKCILLQGQHDQCK